MIRPGSGSSLRRSDAESKPPGALSPDASGASSSGSAGPGSPGDERPPETGPIDTAIEVVRVEAPPSGEQPVVPVVTAAASSESWRWAVVLGVVAVVLGLFAVVASFEPGANVENRAYVDNAATDEVKAAASNALTTIATYSYDNIDEWPDRARSVLTDDMQEQFDKTVDVTRSAAVQSRTSTQARVDEVGVSLLDASHAEVLAFLTVSVENDGVAMGSSAGPQLIRMQKVDDDWLLSEVVLQ
ncbi:MAG TPA: mammalian cell entry protein [Aldersonia sp.]